MKNLFGISILLFLIFSCNPFENSKEEGPKIAQSQDDTFNPIGIDSTLLIKGEYLFYLNKKLYQPLITEGDTSSFSKMIDEKELERKEKTILSDLEAELKLALKVDDIFALTFSGFFVSGISEERALEILSNKNMVSGVQQNFTIQNIRARMQGEGPVLQNIRARMQEWQYNEETHTSSNVSFVNPNSVTTNASRKVWVVDSGVDINHPDLNVIDDSQLTKSFVQSEPDPLYDIVGHGTHIAGIIGGRAHDNNDPDILGMNGVSPGAQIVPIKVINWNGEGSWVNVKKALKRIGVKGESGDVVTLSLGNLFTRPGFDCNSFQKGILEEIEFLALKEIYIVMAAGNTDSLSTLFYPGCFDFNSNPFVITVASLKVTFDFELGNGFSAPEFSEYSNFGIPSIDYVAPGDVIFSTFPNNRYAVLSGTSMATAMVAGIIHLKGGRPSSNSTLVGPPGATTYPIAKF